MEMIKMTINIQQILADHALWIADNSVGTRANLSGASLFGADLSGAYLSGANLSGADLRIAVMDTPVYQFYLGKYNAVATKDYLRVGCEVHSWDEWLTNYNQYGVSAGFSDKEIQDHSRVIKLFHELLCGEIT